MWMQALTIRPPVPIIPTDVDATEGPIGVYRNSTLIPFGIPINTLDDGGNQLNRSI